MQESKVVIVIAVGTALVLAMGIFVTIFLFLYQRRHYRYEQEKEQLSAQFAQTLLQSQIEIQEQTLQYISREIHDNLGHTASLIKINLNTMNTSSLTDIEVKTEQAKELTRQLITDLKSLSVRLNNDRIIQHGFIQALEKEVLRLNQSGMFEASLSIAGDVPAIESDKAIILYRMAQEILNNIIKHSKATKITISLAYIDNSINLVLQDNGRGFDMEQELKKGGAGLFNLRNRAEMLNASLNIESSPGQGTGVTIQMPYS